MNQGRIWCVVNPTVGLPLFIGGVAVTSLIVHASVLTNTTWFGGFLQGKAATKAAAAAAPAIASNGTSGADGVLISVAPKTDTANGETQYVITVAPKATATARADTGLPDKLALASETK